MSAELFTKTTRDGKTILQLKPALLTNPGATVLRNLAYEIVDGSMVQTRIGVVLKSTSSLSIEDIVGIDVRRRVGSAILGVGAADLTFRDSSGSATVVWENVQRAEEVADFIRALKRDSSVWPSSINSHREGNAGANALEIAQKTNRADFGRWSYPAGDKSQFFTKYPWGGSFRKIGEEREVVWTNNGDGTATDPDNRLMWIRAPWGMTWDGKTFSGDPIPISWFEATRMFGKGLSYINGSSVDIDCNLNPDERAATAKEFGYHRGCCTVDFAGEPLSIRV